MIDARHNLRQAADLLVKAGLRQTNRTNASELWLETTKTSAGYLRAVLGTDDTIDVLVFNSQTVLLWQVRLRAHTPWPVIQVTLQAALQEASALPPARGSYAKKARKALATITLIGNLTEDTAR